MSGQRSDRAKDSSYFWREPRALRRPNQLPASPLLAVNKVPLSGVANVPWRATAAEQVLIGQAPDSELLTAAADAALSAVEPLSKNGYKVPIAHTLVRRALEAAIG